MSTTTQKIGIVDRLAELCAELLNEKSFKQLPQRMRECNFCKTIFVEEREFCSVPSCYSFRLRSLLRELEETPINQHSQLVDLVRRLRTERQVLRDAARIFVRRCEVGEVRSVVNQKMFRDALEATED